MNKYLYILFKILSFSPLFRITDDSQFNEITKKSSEFRFSLISFNLGIKSYHFFTRSHDGKLQFLHILDLYKVKRYNEIIRKNGDDYDTYLMELHSKTHEKRMSEKEFILFKIAEEVNIKNKTFNKFLAYIAIIAFILPLYAPKLTDLSPYFGSYKTFFVLGLLYLFVNLICLTYSYIKVRGYKRTVLSSLRNDENPDVLLVALLYYEWKNTVNESVMGVSIIKNIEKYMFILIIFSGAIVICSNIEAWKMSDEKKPAVESTTAETELLTLRSEINTNDFIKNNKQQIESINDALLSGEYKTVLIVSNEKDRVSDDLKRLLDLYKSEEVSIMNIMSNEPSDNIQIILLKE